MVGSAFVDNQIKICRWAKEGGGLRCCPCRWTSLLLSFMSGFERQSLGFERRSPIAGAGGGRGMAELRSGGGMIRLFGCLVPNKQRKHLFCSLGISSQDSRSSTFTKWHHLWNILTLSTENILKLQKYKITISRIFQKISSQRWRRLLNFLTRSVNKVIDRICLTSLIEWMKI